MSRLCNTAFARVTVYIHGNLHLHHRKEGHRVGHIFSECNSVVIVNSCCGKPPEAQIIYAKMLIKWHSWNGKMENITILGYLNCTSFHFIAKLLCLPQVHPDALDTIAWVKFGEVMSRPF